MPVLEVAVARRGNDNLVLPKLADDARDDAAATVDRAGHGTHVAGILAGGQALAPGAPALVAATWYEHNDGSMQVARQEFREALAKLDAEPAGSSLRARERFAPLRADLRRGAAGQ